MASEDRGAISYEPIPEGAGHVCLTIYRPGAWMGNPGYHVFVGGNGVGVATTLKRAEDLLLRQAAADQRRRAKAHRDAMEHAEAQIERLRREGLRKIKTKAARP